MNTKMELKELSKNELKIADMLHFELTDKYGMTYSECVKLAKIIYEMW